MPTFTPPTVQDRGRNPYVEGVVKRWPALYRGKNVYKLTSGSYTESQPSDMTTVAITYQGGHVHVVTTAEGNALTSAGYVVV